MSLQLATVLVLFGVATLSGQAPPERMKAAPAAGARIAPVRDPALGVDIVAKNVVPVNFLQDKPVYAGQATKLECVVYEYHPEGTDPAPLTWTGRVEAEGKVLATFSSTNAERDELAFDGSTSMTTWSYGYKADWTPAKSGYNATRCVVDIHGEVAETQELNNAKDSKAWVEPSRSVRPGPKPPPRVALPPGGAPPPPPQ